MSSKISRAHVTEIKSLASPPPAVVQMMTCTLLLLGHPAVNTKDWGYCKKVLGDIKKFLENLEKNDPKNCKPENLLMAKEILDSTSRDGILKNSFAAAALYDWNIEIMAAASSTSSS